MKTYSKGTEAIAGRANPRGYYDYNGLTVKRPLFPQYLANRLSASQKLKLKKRGNIVMLKVVDDYRGCNYEPIIVERNSLLRRIYR